MGAVLVLAFVTGGGSYDRGFGDVAAQLAAIPLLAWALFALTMTPGSTARRAAVAAAALVVLVVVLQQLPLPAAAWSAIEARAPLADDLRIAGVEGVRHGWSLTPLAGERGAWSLLPALAVFLGALAIPADRYRPLLLTVVLLAGASLLLGYLQLGAPQESLLNPFPEWRPALNGVFANPNHQASALALSLAAILALLLYDRNRHDGQGLARWARVSLGIGGVLMLASLPLTGSRAALLIAVVVLVGVALGLRHGASRHARSGSRQRWLQVVLALVALGAVASAVSWLQVDIEEEVRWEAAAATMAMASSHAPAGAGLGSFVPWFDQAAPERLVGRAYFNHAHNEYVQWWFESGVAGLLALLFALAVLAWAFPRRGGGGAGRGDHGVAVAAWAGCAVLLLHSVVDYPLRTPALMTVGALLAGLAVASRVQAGKTTGPKRRRATQVAASQQA